MFEIVQLNARQFRLGREPLQQVHWAAFAGPPYYESEQDAVQVIERLALDSSREGFRCCIARGPSGAVLGFAVGFRGEPGQWWYDRVSELLTPELVREWMSDCFQFEELAVAPEAQRKGIGNSLHDRLLAGLPYRTAVLSTFSGITPALYLYRKHGWKTLLPRFCFPGYDMPMMVLAVQLADLKEANRT